MEVHAKLQFTFCQGVERKPLVHCHGWTGRGENTRTVALINSLYQHSTLIMIIVAILILMADLIQGLRVSDAWVDDIERLKPATSNRIETFIFPTKNLIQDLKDTNRMKGNIDEKSSDMLFEPLYFKFRHKLDSQVSNPVLIEAKEKRKRRKTQNFLNRGFNDLY